jgi:hypothetical protein
MRVAVSTRSGLPVLPKTARDRTQAGQGEARGREGQKHAHRNALFGYQAADDVTMPMAFLIEMAPR